MKERLPTCIVIIYNGTSDTFLKPPSSMASSPKNTTWNEMATEISNGEWTQCVKVNILQTLVRPPASIASSAMNSTWK